MFADLIDAFTGLVTDAGGLAAAIVGLIAVAVGIGWAKRIGSKAG